MKRTGVWLFWISAAQVLSEGISERSCLMLDQTEGWLCLRSGECIWKDWVCDRNVQCPDPDDSDEKEGCQLFPDSGCQSWFGRRHDKLCPDDPDRCVEDVSECVTAYGPSEEEGREKEDPFFDKIFWKCKDGLTILKAEVCDRTPHCKDQSDEKEGCDLFPESGCQSLHGLRHVPCLERNTSLSVCTLPEYLESDDCRKCPDPDQWRCDNGECIRKDLVGSGVKDCSDGSDEYVINLRWWKLFIITLSITAFGLLLSYVYRFFNTEKQLFFCEACQIAKLNEYQKKKSQSVTPKEDDFSDSTAQDEVKLNSIPLTNVKKDPLEVVDGEVVDSNYDPEEIPHPECILPSCLIDILEDKEYWRSSKDLINDSQTKGLRVYAQVHQDPILFKNLYFYLVFRYPNPRELANVTQILHRWEMEFHGEESRDVEACLRLHLGCCENLKTILASFEKLSQFECAFYDNFIPVRNWFRSLRKQYSPRKFRRFLEGCYTILKVLYYSMSPFLSASFFYFDICKDICLGFIIYISLYDMTQGDFWHMDYTFEVGLIFTLILGLCLVQFLFIIISGYYSTTVFEMCKHSESNGKKNLFFVFSVIFAPLMPAFIIANHAYYNERVYSAKRDLQSFRSSFIYSHDPEDSDHNHRYRIFLFNKVLRMRYRSFLFRRIYSFFRVAQAVIGSVAIIVVFTLVMVVTARPGRPVHLIVGVQENICTFFDLDSGFSSQNIKSGTLLSSLNVTGDLVFVASMCLSFYMMTSALVRYVYQSKVMNMTLSGQVCLSIYYVAHTICRLTIIIALFSTAEADSTIGPRPVIPLFPASVISTLLVVLQFIFIYVFKCRYVSEFNEGNFMERLINVLVNTLVVIPYTSWDVPHEPPARNEESWCEESVSEGEKGNNANVVRRRAQSIKDSKLFTKMDPEDEQEGLNLSLVHGPLFMKIGRLSEEIEKIWWTDPTRELKMEQAIEKLPPKFKAVDNQIIQRTLTYLTDNGFINKTLFNPRRTKHEYFWLLCLQFIINIFSLIVELSNGGFVMNSGRHYYSWDIRLGTFIFGLIFLIIYYKRYHVSRNLMDVQFFGYCWRSCPIFCCLKKDAPLQAIPVEDEMQRCLEDCEKMVESVVGLSPSKITMWTQTSMIENESKNKYLETDLDQITKLEDDQNCITEKDKDAKL